MTKSTLFLSALIAASGAQADCLLDNPEMGDVGPASERVCRYLEQRFPTSALAVRGREIHSADGVSVLASVDGRAVRIEYELIGPAWRVYAFDTRDAVARSSGAPQGERDMVPPAKQFSMR